jgi:hypothetical protein
MAEELIRQYIDRDAFRADTEFATKNIEEVIRAFVGLQSTISKTGQSGKAVDIFPGITAMNTALTTSIKLSKEEAGIRAANARALKEEANSRAANAKAAAAEANAKKATTQASAAETAATEKQTKAREKAAAASAREEKSIREAQRSYKSLAREYEILRKNAEDLGASLGVNSKQYIEAAKRAGELNGRLKAIDAGIGNFQRNVGNYASGFNGLGNSINQITRELPSFANSVQTGFLAISNNLPIFFDEISRARQEITRLKEAGEQAPTVFQALGKAFFSLGTLLSLGVTVLTLYGAKLVELVVGLFDTEKAQIKALESTRKLNEAQVELNRAMENYKEAIKVDFGTLLAGLKSQLLYAEALGKTDAERLAIAKQIAEQELLQAQNDYFDEGGVLKLEELQQAFNAADIAKKQFLLNPPEASSSFLDNLPSAKAIEAQKNSLESNVTLTQQAFEKQKKLASDYAKALTAFNVAQINLDRSRDQSRNDEVDKTRSYYLQLLDLRLQAQIKEKQLIADAEGLSVETRRKAKEDQIELEVRSIEIKRQLAELEARQSVNLEDKTAAEIATIQRNLAAQIALINEKAEIEKAEVRANGNTAVERIGLQGLAQSKKIYDEDVQLWEDAQKEKTSIVEQQAEEQARRLSNRQAFLEQDRDIRLKALEGKRAAGLISERQYQEEREKIVNDSQEFLIRAEIDYVKSVLEIRKQAGQDVAQQEAKLASLELQLIKDKNDRKAKEEDQFQKTRAAKLRDLQGELLNLFTSVVDGAFERQKNALQDQIDLIEIRKQREIEAINASLLSEQEKADKISVLNARAAAEREALQRRQRQIDQEKARFEKAASIARVTQSTVEAVVATLGQKPWTPANIALASIIGAIGAAQIARIIATPIPRYKTGTGNHPGGLAIVGDGGQREVVEMGGRAYLTPDKDTLLDMPAGAKVYPSVDAFNEAANRMLYKSIDPLPAGQVIDEAKLAGMMLAGIEKVVGRIENLPLQSFEIRDGELRTMIRRGGSTTEYINRNIKS